MPSNIKNFFKPIPNAKNPHKEKQASIENNKENQAPPTVETLNSDKKSISSQHEEKELVDLTQPISPKPSNIQTSDPTTPNKNTRRSSRPTTPVTPNPNDTSISPKPRKNNKKLTVEEKAAREEARRIEREKKQAEKEAKKLEDKKRKEEEKKIKDAEKEKKKAEEKAIKDKERADKKAKEAAEREAKKAKEAAEKEAERKRKDAERKVLAEQKKIEAEAKKEKDKKEREAKKEEEKRKKEEERLLEKKQQEEKERLKAEKLKAKRWGGFLKVEKKSKKELSDVQRGPFRLEFQKRKFYVNPSEVYSDFVRKAFGKTENSFFVENDSMDIDENSNYLSELSERSDQLKIVGTGLKLKILENNRESEIICLEDDQKSPTHPLNFFHYKTCKRFYYGTSSTFRTAAGNNSRKIARNPFRKQQSIFVRNGIELDYDYDSEYEWENEPSDAESCDSADEEEDLDDQHDNLENDDFCVPHGYLSDDEEGHEQAQAEENLNYKKQKIKSLIPYVLVKNHGDNGNESPRQSEHLLVKNLAKIGVAMVKTKVIDQTPKVSICAKSEHFRDVSDLRSLLENVQIGKIPRRLTRETDQTKVSASFPCMDDLCKLLHMNPLALSKITEEFKMHLEMKRGKKEIPGYTLPTIAQIKKRIQKISQCRVKDGNELEVDQYCEAWEWYFPGHQTNYEELVSKEADRIRKRQQKEANRIEREKKQQLKEAKSFAQKQKIENTVPNGHTDIAEKRKNPETSNPTPKRVKLESSNPQVTNFENRPASPVTPNIERTGNLLKFLTVQTKEERANAIKSCPENLNPELKVIGETSASTSVARSISPVEHQKFILPTQEGINKMFNSAKNDKNENKHGNNDKND